MSVDIIPAGSTAVVTEKHDRHDHQGDRYRNHDRFAQVSRDVKDSRFDIVQEVNKNGSTSQLATKDARYDVVQEVNKNGSASVLATKDARQEMIEAMTKGFTASALASAHTNEEMCEAFDESTDKVLSAVRHGTEESQENFCALQKQISDSATSTLVGFKDLTALSYQIEGRGLLEAAKNANAAAVQADRNWAATNLQAQTNSAASTLLATQIAAQAAKEAAECCCELKELIRADGEKTRDLISDQEVDRLRDRAAKAEQMLAAYFAAKSVPTIP